MKLQAILLAATSLFALGIATANIAARSPQQSDVVAIAAPAVNAVEASGTIENTKQVRTTTLPIDARIACHFAKRLRSRMWRRCALRKLLHVHPQEGD